MNVTDLAMASLGGNLEMLKSHIADFSDQDMMVRPVPNANHTTWQLGHLLTSEVWMINKAVPGAVPALPAGFAEKFSKETSKIDDPKAFPSKAEILAAYDATRTAVIKWVKSLTPADLDKPGPAEMKDFIPTVQQRGAAIIEARGASSAASAANAALDHMRDWALGTAAGDWVSMAVPSDGSYGVPDGLISGFPCTTANGNWSIVPDLAIDDFSRARIDASVGELGEERDAVTQLGLI